MFKKLIALILVCAFTLCAIPRYAEAAASNEAKYKQYLNTLSPKKPATISQAVAKFKAYAGKDKAQNDKLFRLFRTYYQKVVKSNDITEAEVSTSKYSEDAAAVKKLNDRIKALKAVGIGFWYGEEGWFGTAENFEFLLSTFTRYVSEGVRSFLTVKKTLAEEELFATSAVDMYIPLSDLAYDQLGDQIVLCEGFISKYGNSPEKQEVQKQLDELLGTYLVGLAENTWNCGIYSEYGYLDVEERKTKKDAFGIDERITKSYLNFIRSHSKSKYAAKVKKGYDILKANQFMVSWKVIEELCTQKMI